MKQKFNIGDSVIAKGVFRIFGYGTVVDVCATRHANNKCRKLYIVEYLDGNRRSYWSYELMPYNHNKTECQTKQTEFNFISDDTIPDNLIEYVKHDINMCNTLNINVKYVPLEKIVKYKEMI